jgi:hypothetical protein
LIGPVLWPAAQISSHSTWHPCLLAEVRADNDDSAGGIFGSDIPADPNPAAYGSHFWGNNNVCQRNLSYAPVKANSAARVSYSFVVGHALSKARFLEVILEKPLELATTPMMLTMAPISLPTPGHGQPCKPGELIFKDTCHVLVRHGNCDIGEFDAKPGTIWRHTCPLVPGEHKTCHGGKKTDQGWEITNPRGAVGFPVAPGELRRMTLTFTTPTTLKPRTSPIVRMLQRSDTQTITGGEFLQLKVT